MTQEKRRSLFLGLFAVAMGIGFGWPLAEDLPSGAVGYRRSRGARRTRRRDFGEYVGFLLNAAIAVTGVAVGGTSFVKALKKD